MTTAAAIDRLVHHSAILEFGGRSKRGDVAEQRSQSTQPEARSGLQRLSCPMSER